MTPCGEVLDLLSDHFDGRFGPDDPRREVVETHLAGCGDCRRILLDYSLMRAAMRPGPERVPDPASFEARLSARLRSEPHRAPWIPLSAAAAALALAVTGWTLFSPRRPAATTPVSIALPVRPESPATLEESVRARDLVELEEELRLLRPRPGPEAIRKELTSLPDLDPSLPAIEEVSFER